MYSNYLGTYMKDKSNSTNSFENLYNLSDTTLSTMYVGCGNNYYAYSSPTIPGRIYCKADININETLYVSRPNSTLNNVGKTYFYDNDIAIFDDMNGQKYLIHLNCSSVFTIDIINHNVSFEQALPYDTLGNLYSTGGWMAYLNKDVSNKFYLLGTRGDGTINYRYVDPDNNFTSISGQWTVNQGETIIEMFSQKQGSILVTIYNNTITSYTIDESEDTPQLVQLSVWDTKELFDAYHFVDSYLNTTSVFSYQHLILFQHDYISFMSSFQRLENILTLYRVEDGNMEQFTVNFQCQDNLTSNGQNLIFCHQPDGIITIDLNNILTAPENFTADVTSCYLIDNCVNYQQQTQDDYIAYVATLINTDQEMCQQCDQSKNINLYYESPYEHVMFQALDKFTHCQEVEENGKYYVECDEEHTFQANVSNIKSTNSIFSSDSFISATADNKLISSQSITHDNNVDSCYTIKDFNLTIEDNFVYFTPNDSSTTTCVADNPKIVATFGKGPSKVEVELKPKNISQFQTPVQYYAYMDPGFSKTITSDQQVSITVTQYTTTNQIFKTETKVYDAETTIQSCFMLTSDLFDVDYYPAKGKLILSPSYFLKERFVQPCSMNMSAIDSINISITLNDATTIQYDDNNFKENILFNNREETYLQFNQNHDYISSLQISASLNNQSVTLDLSNQTNIRKIPCILIEDSFRVYYDSNDYTYIEFSETPLCPYSELPNYEYLFAYVGDSYYEVDDLQEITDNNGIKRYRYIYEEVIPEMNITYNITIIKIKEIELKTYENIKVLDCSTKTDLWYVVLLVYIVIIAAYYIGTVLVYKKITTGSYPWQTEQFKQKYNIEDSVPAKQSQSFSFDSQNEDEILLGSSTDQNDDDNDSKDENGLFDIPS